MREKHRYSRFALDRLEMHDILKTINLKYLILDMMLILDTVKRFCVLQRSSPIACGKTAFNRVSIHLD